MFELLGWDNPWGSFPNPVVPIGRLGGKLVAIYNGAPDPISEEDTYVHFTAPQLEILQGFDYQRDQLFAINERNVILS